MAASEGLFRVTAVARAPRWRALAATIAVVGALWGTGFAVGQATAPDTAVTPRQAAVESTPEFIRPGTDRGQAKYGPGAAERSGQRTHPAGHGGGRVKGG